MVEINQTDKDNAEAILRAFINENFPDIETRKGSAFRSLVISPAASFYALMQAETKILKDSQSILSLSEATDSSVLEEILANFLLTKNTGSKSTGMLRIDVSSNKTYTVPANVQFTNSSGVIFQNTVDYVFEKDSPVEEGKGNLFFDSVKGSYFFLLPVESLDSTSVQILQDEVFTIDAAFFIDNTLLSIKANTNFSVGRDTETIEEFKTRVEESVTVRNLVTKKAIKAVLKDYFPALLEVFPVGHGDDEMLRDLILPQGIHKGGAVDIYCRAGSIPQQVSFEKSIIVNSQVELVSPETPLFRVDKVELKSGELLQELKEGTDYTVSFSHNTPGNLSFSLNTLAPVYSRFSSNEKCVIKFTNPELTGQRVLVTVTKPPSLNLVQNFVDLEDNRVMCADLLVKTLAPVFISLDIKYRVKSGVTPPTDTEIISSLQSYVNSLNGAETVEIDKVVTALLSIDSIAGISLPLEGTAVVHKPDGTTETLVFKDKLTIDSKPSIGFSQNICQYILLAQDVTLTSI